MSTISISVRCGNRETVYRLRFWEFEHPGDLVFEDACESAQNAIEFCLESVAETVAARKAVLAQPKSQITKAV